MHYPTKPSFRMMSNNTTRYIMHVVCGRRSDYSMYTWQPTYCDRVPFTRRNSKFVTTYWNCNYDKLMYTLSLIYFNGNCTNKGWIVTLTPSDTYQSTDIVFFILRKTHMTDYSSLIWVIYLHIRVFYWTSAFNQHVDNCQNIYWQLSQQKVKE